MIQTRSDVGKRQSIRPSTAHSDGVMMVRPLEIGRVVLTLLVGLAARGPQSFAATYYVVAGGAPTGREQGTEGDPFRSIQQAIHAAATNDPGDGRHTIRVEAGIYNAGQEEAFQNDGADSYGTLSLIRVPPSPYLNGLTIAGAGSATTVVDADKSLSNCRVLRIESTGTNGVAISGLTLRGGKCQAAPAVAAPMPVGCGVWASTTNLWLEDVRVTGCSSASAANRAVVYVQGSGTRLTRVRVDGNAGGSSISNSAALFLSGDGFRMTHCRIENNAPLWHGFYWTHDVEGACGVVFGSLIAGNGHGGVGTTFQAGRLYLVNCTVADNGGYGASQTKESCDVFSGGQWNLNTIYSRNDRGIHNSAGISRPFRYLRCWIDDSKAEVLPFTFNLAYMDGYSTSAGDDGTNVTGADPGCRGPRPAFADKAVANGTSTRLCVAAPGLYATNDMVEVNCDGVARQVTAVGSDYIEVGQAMPRASEPGDFLRNWGGRMSVPEACYRPAVRAGVLDRCASLLCGTNGCRYVDVDANGTYDPGLDVIVSLGNHVPAAEEWVATQDLDSKPRCRGRGLDTGAFEQQMLRGTVVTVH